MARIRSSDRIGLFELCYCDVIGRKRELTPTRICPSSWSPRRIKGPFRWSCRRFDWLRETRLVSRPHTLKGRHSRHAKVPWV